MKLTTKACLKPAKIELLPLIDVVFILLIFFLFVLLKLTMQTEQQALTKKQKPQLAAAHKTDIQQQQLELAATLQELQYNPDNIIEKQAH